MTPVGPNTFRLTGSGAISQRCYVYASTNLTLPINEWWLLGTTNADAAGLVQFLDTQATNAQRFYRLSR